MAHLTETLRKFLASRSVAAVFGLQIAVFIGGYTAAKTGLDTVVDYLGIVGDITIFTLLLISQQIPWSWLPAIQINNETVLFGTVLLAAFALYYAVAVVIAVPGRIAYRSASNRLR